MSTDYKLIEQMVPNRLEPSLDNIIHSDQCGFMRNRRISVNIRKIFDLMHFATESGLESCILSLDFEKCFDKIETTAIIGVMNYFKTSEYLTKWVQILYGNFHARIQTNGHFSNKIPIEKGVHQGGVCFSDFILTLRRSLSH